MEGNTEVMRRGAREAWFERGDREQEKMNMSIVSPIIEKPQEEFAQVQALYHWLKRRRMESKHQVLQRPLPAGSGASARNVACNE